MTISHLSVIVSPLPGDCFGVCVKSLTPDAIDSVDVYEISVSEEDAERAFKAEPTYAAMMGWAAREAARRSGYTGRLAGAYAGDDFVFVALDGYDQP